VTGLHKIDAAKRNPARQPTTRADVLVAWRRLQTIGVVVLCSACGRQHGHSIALGAGPVIRASRCGLATYRIDASDALAVTA
jgi:hypothetical protein